MGNVAVTGLTFNNWACTAEGGPGQKKFSCQPAQNSQATQFTYSCNGNGVCQPTGAQLTNTPTVQCHQSYAKDYLSLVCQPTSIALAPLLPARPQAPRSNNFPPLNLQRPVTPDLAKAQHVLEKTDWHIAATQDRLWLFQFFGIILFLAIVFLVLVSIADESD